MCAFYGLQYDIKTAEDIENLTNVADYYCALPRVSSTIHSSLVRTGKLEIFRICAPDLLECSFKLRQPELFRDFLAIIAGEWDTELYAEHLKKISRPILRKTITSVRNGICAKIAQAQEDIIKLAEHNDSFGAQMMMPYHTAEYHKFSLPVYYRMVSNMEMENVLGEKVVAYSELPSLRVLLRDHTMLLGFAPDDEESPTSSFLCGEIEDEDLPVSYAAYPGCSVLKLHLENTMSQSLPT